MVFARAESLGKGRNMIMSKDEYLITDEPLKALTIFAMPMILGSFFQQVYNMADSIIVGQFVVSLAPIIAQIAGIALCRNAFWVGQQTLCNTNTISRFTCAICLRLFPSGVRSFHLA